MKNINEDRVGAILGIVALLVSIVYYIICIVFDIEDISPDNMDNVAIPIAIGVVYALISSLLIKIYIDSDKVKFDTICTCICCAALPLTIPICASYMSMTLRDLGLTTIIMKYRGDACIWALVYISVMFVINPVFWRHGLSGDSPDENDC